MDRLRVEAKLRACLLEIGQLKKESLAKDERLAELVGATATKKLLREDVTQDCLLASVIGDKLKMQLVGAQANVRAYKRKLRQSHYELQLAESNLMAEWLVGFYSGFDMLVEVAMVRFSGVDLSTLKVEHFPWITFELLREMSRER